MSGKLVPFPITIKNGYVENSEKEIYLPQPSYFEVDYQGSKKIPVVIKRLVLIDSESCTNTQYEVCIDKTSCPKILASGKYIFSMNGGYAVREEDGVYNANLFFEYLSDSNALIMK